MSQFDIFHTLEILRAAFPYLDSRSKDTLELYIKAGDLLECLNKRRQGNTVSTFSFSEDDNNKRDEIDMLGLLNSVRNVCYDDEVKLVDSLLNLMNVMEQYETYMNLFSMMSPDGDLGGLGSMFGMEGRANSSGDMLEMLSSMLSPDDGEAFGNLSMILNMMNSPDKNEPEVNDEEESKTQDVDESNTIYDDYNNEHP